MVVWIPSDECIAESNVSLDTYLGFSLGHERECGLELDREIEENHEWDDANLEVNEVFVLENWEDFVDSCVPVSLGFSI